MKKAIVVLFFTIGFLSFGASAQVTPTKAPFSIADSSSYTGKYKFEGMPFEYIEISVKEGKLYFVGGDFNGFLVPKGGSKDVFDVNEVAVYTFVRNGDNKITQLNVEYQGNVSSGKKEDKK